MKKAIAIFIFFMSCSSAVLAQISFDIKHKNMKVFEQLEDANKSAIFKIETSYIMGRNVGQPIVYRRKEIDKKLPDGLVYYFPTKSDSSVYEVLYEWDETHFTENHKAYKHYGDTIKSFIKKYNELLAMVKTQFGEGKTKGSLDDLSQIETGNFSRYDSFTKDSVEVEMSIILSNEYVRHGNITDYPQQRIKLHVRNKTIEEEVLKLDEQKVIDADKRVKLFLTALTKSNFVEARKYVAQKIAAKITNEQLAALQPEIKDNKWELRYTGVQLTLTNTMMGSLRYQRTGDNTTQGAEVLIITLDENYEIIGIRPLKLQ